MSFQLMLDDSRAIEVLGVGVTGLTNYSDCVLGANREPWYDFRWLC